MKTYLPESEYHALLEFSESSAVWTWHHGWIDPRALHSLAQRLPQMARMDFPDNRERPLAFFLCRLFYELGVLTHEPSAEASTNVDIRPEFLGSGDHAKIVFSFGTPWGIREVPASAINDLLTVATVMGDGSAMEIEHVSGGILFGLRLDRALDLIWTSEEEGRLVMEPPEEVEEDLVVAFDLGSELRLVNCGRPRFKPVNLEELEGNGWQEVFPPEPSSIYPKTYGFRDRVGRGGVEKRFHLPGTEAGYAFRLSGAAFTRDGEDCYSVSSTLGDDGPVIRVHLEYWPGWMNASLGNLGRRKEWAWNLLTDEFKQELADRFPLIREN